MPDRKQIQLNEDGTVRSITEFTPASDTPWVVTAPSETVVELGDIYDLRA